MQGRLSIRSISSVAYWLGISTAYWLDTNRHQPTQGNKCCKLHEANIGSLRELRVYFCLFRRVRHDEAISCQGISNHPTIASPRRADSVASILHLFTIHHGAASKPHTSWRPRRLSRPPSRACVRHVYQEPQDPSLRSASTNTVWQMEPQQHRIVYVTLQMILRRLGIIPFDWAERLFFRTSWSGHDGNSRNMGKFIHQAPWHSSTSWMHTFFQVRCRLLC